MLFKAFLRSSVFAGRYPRNANDWPFSPEDMSASISDDGPTKGTTWMPLRWQRATRAAYEPDISALEQGSIGFHLLGCGMLVKLVELEFFNMALQPCLGQETACCANLLDHEYLQAGQEFQHRCRYDLSGLVFSER